MLQQTSSLKLMNTRRRHMERLKALTQHLIFLLFWNTETLVNETNASISVLLITVWLQYRLKSSSGFIWKVLKIQFQCWGFGGSHAQSLPSHTRQNWSDIWPTSSTWAAGSATTAPSAFCVWEKHAHNMNTSRLHITLKTAWITITLLIQFCVNVSWLYSIQCSVLYHTHISANALNLVF